MKWKSKKSNFTLDSNHKINHHHNMTKKHFTAIAEIVGKRLREKITAPIAQYEAIELVANDLAAYFETQNSSFDKNRFLEAVYTQK